MKTKSIRFARMTAVLLLPLFLLIFIVLQAYGARPGQRLWVKRYNFRRANGNDVANAIAVDASGNVYVTGRSQGSGTDYDYTTIKYRPTGKKKWVRRYDEANGDDIANAIAVDASSNVYVTGSAYTDATDEEYATIKYGPRGKRQWLRRYDVAYDWWDYATAIAVDSRGNVYVTGSSFEYKSLSGATIKYGPRGKRKWVNTGFGSAIAVDVTGNVYVAGMYDGWLRCSRYATTKYSSAGDHKWTALYPGPEDFLCGGCRAIAVDASGNVYVTGYSYGSGTGYDYATIKYDSAGNEKWVRRYDGPTNGDDRAAAIALDSSGNVYVTGTSEGDYATVKYDSAGETKWVRRYNGSANGNDGATAMALDTSDNVHVTGYSCRPSTGCDYLTIKYDSAGNTLWVRRYNYRRANGPDAATAIALDASGNVYVTGYSQGSGTGCDYATIKYAP